MKTEDISKNQVSPTGPAPYVLNVNTERLHEMAEGYKRLGQFDEARALCVTIPEDDPNWEYTQFLLLGLDLYQERMTDAANMLEGQPEVESVQDKNGILVVKLNEGVVQYSFLASRLIEQGYDLTLFKEDEINLETAFMHLTKGITS